MTLKLMRFLTSVRALVVTAVICLGFVFGPYDSPGAAEAQAETQALYYKNYYYPGTEALGADEMRVIALGTGMPILRKSQASSSWLVELGNGDKFLFDLGTGSQMNFTVLQVPFRQVDKVFLSHLHTDHAGDLPALWIGGWVGGRFDRPLRVWGPSGARAQTGTQYFIDRQIEAWTWDVESRHGKLPAAGAEIEVHEFDHSKSQTIYDDNGVKISSFPAFHIMEGPVSFRLEWNDLVFVFSGDTTPTQFFVDHGQNADLLIHETFAPVKHLMRGYGWDRRTATQVGTVVHSSPAQAGRIFSLTKPKHAVGYHFFNEFDTVIDVEHEVRQTYDGPLTLANDLMVFNVTKAGTRVREVVAQTSVWPEQLPREAFGKAKRLKNAVQPKWMQDARLYFDQ